MTTIERRRWQALFVSDVHLDESLPQTTRTFLEFLSGPALETQELILCGDLFEYWAGDDDLDTPYHRRIISALRNVSDSGTMVGWLPGNRDFLVGRRFADAAGLRLLDDPHVFETAGDTVVVTHGDALCTDDVAYQQFRIMVRNPAWRQAFLDRPLAERKAIIATMRQQSMAGKSVKAMEIMDVNATAVSELFKASGSRIMIHGHTHRPARHEILQEAMPVLRYVLPDWELDHEPHRGGWLTMDRQGNVRRFGSDGVETAFDHS